MIFAIYLTTNQRHIGLLTNHNAECLYHQPFCKINGSYVYSRSSNIVDELSCKINGSSSTIYWSSKRVATALRV